MSQDFKKVLVKDNRLMVTDSVKYAVVKGGSNMTCSRFPAIGSGPFTSTINFNIQVPSQETVISRNALIQATMIFKIAGNTVATATNPNDAVDGINYLFNYGGVDAFGPFPFHQCVNSTQWTINNNTVSQNTRDILAIICRIHDKRWLSRYNGMTPTMFDSYFVNPLYQSGYSAPVPNVFLNNVNSSFTSMSLDNDLLTRGAFPISIYSDGTLVSAANYLPAGGARTIYIQITVTEPVLVSPWTFAGDDGQGMYGIQNLNAVYNLNQQANTAVRFGAVNAFRFTGGTVPIVTLQQVSNATLLLQFLTPHPSDLMPSRNVLPYYELPRYITPAPAIVTGTTVTISSQSLQLNQIPDKLYISVGKPMGSRTNTDTDSWLTIQGISINWNNSSGLLSSATQQDLWRMSVENGINLNWLEFSGIAQATPVVANASTANGGLSQILTCGSVLCLEFGKDIELKDDYYAPGSLGNFQLQFNLIVKNQSGLNVAQGDYQILTMVQNSGVFSLERGVASSYLGILTKSDVLEASRTQAHGYSDALRMVGGGETPSFSSRLMATLGRLAPAGLDLLKKGVEDYQANKGKGYSGGKRHKDMGALEDRLH